MWERADDRTIITALKILEEREKEAKRQSRGASTPAQRDPGAGGPPTGRISG